jgi:hypothetical protein
MVARLGGPASLWSGGGSKAFWRPIPHQLYYLVMAPRFYSAPWLVPLLHGAVLCAIGYMLIATLRHRLGMAAAGCVAGFLLLSEPARSLLTWPSHFVELSFLFGLALAVCAAEAGWVLLAGCAFAATLLCKETALLAVPLIALVPSRRLHRGSRLRLLIALGLIGLVWCLAYAHARSAYHLIPPPSITLAPPALAHSALTRIAWVAGRCTLVALGLDAPSHPVRSILMLAYAALAAIVLVILLLRSRVRPCRFDSSLIAWSTGWIALFAAGLIVTYPAWAAHRALVVGIGIGALLVSILEPIHAALPVCLVGIKLVALLVSPSAPRFVGVLPPSPDAFLDYQRLARLQILARDMRLELKHACPVLPRYSLVVERDFPYATTYALGGSNALRAWYADTTLAWRGYEAFLADTTLHPVCLVEAEDRARPAVSIVPGDALMCQIRGDAALAGTDTLLALSLFDRALSHAMAGRMPTFEASCRYRRAICLAGLGRLASAEVEARRAARVPLYEGDARFLLALVLADEGRLQEALDETSRILAVEPMNDRAGQLRLGLSRALQSRRR